MKRVVLSCALALLLSGCDSTSNHLLDSVPQDAAQDTGGDGALPDSVPDDLAMPDQMTPDQQVNDQATLDQTDDNQHPADLDDMTPGDIADDLSHDADAADLPDVPGSYAVHEWGVLANDRMQGAPTSYESMDKKPILYFYADEELVVDASVTIIGGIGQETWPEVELASTLSWPGLVVKGQSCDTYTPFPAYGQGQCQAPFEEPCEATSLLSTVVADASCLEFNGVTSPVLFYAGKTDPPVVPVWGDFALLTVEPAEVSVTFHPNNGFVDQYLVLYRDLTATTNEFGAEVTSEAKFAYAFVDVPEVVPEEGISVSLFPQVTVDPSGFPEVDYAALFDQIVAKYELMLLAQGLTQAETDAFLNTWATTLFSTWAIDGHPDLPPGISVSVVGILDQQSFDALLPLTLSPSPQELVRVLVSYTYL